MDLKEFYNMSELDHRSIGTYLYSSDETVIGIRVNENFGIKDDNKLIYELLDKDGNVRFVKN